MHDEEKELRRDVAVMINFASIHHMPLFSDLN